MPRGKANRHEWGATGWLIRKPIVSSMHVRTCIGRMDLWFHVGMLPAYVGLLRVRVENEMEIFYLVPTCFVHELRVRNTLMAHRESAEPPHPKERNATRYLHATETERVGRRQQHVAWSERAVAAFVTFSAYCLGSWHSFKIFGDSKFFIQVTILYLPILFCNEFSI